MGDEEDPLKIDFKDEQKPATLLIPDSAVAPSSLDGDKEKEKAKDDCDRDKDKDRNKPILAEIKNELNEPGVSS